MNSTPRALPPWAGTQLLIAGSSALGLGLALIFLPPQTILTITQNILGRPLTPVTLQTNLDALGQSMAFSGVLSFAVGVADIVSYTHGYEEWIYISIPAKLALSAMALAIWVLVPEKMSPLLLALCLVDGLSALGLAWAVGDVTGRVPEGYRSGKKVL